MIVGTLIGRNDSYDSRRYYVSATRASKTKFRLNNEIKSNQCLAYLIKA